MRKGILGSIAALAAGAGSAWGQAPMPIAAAGGQSIAGDERGRDPGIGTEPDSHAAHRGRPAGRPAGSRARRPARPASRSDVPDARPVRRADVPAAARRRARRRPTAVTVRLRAWWFDGEYLLWFAGPAGQLPAARPPAHRTQAGHARAAEHDQLVPGERHQLQRDQRLPAEQRVLRRRRPPVRGPGDRVLHRAAGSQSTVRDVRAARLQLGRDPAPGPAVHRHRHGPRPASSSTNR